MTTTQTSDTPTSRAVIYIPDREFLLPYFRRQLPDYSIETEIPSDGTDVSLAVMISSTDVYDAASGHMLTEETPLRASSPWRDREEKWRVFCEASALPCTVVRCPEIVATAMNGLPMRMARGIARGMLMHIRGNQGCLSLVHGVDVARLSVITAVQGHTFNLTDGQETKVDDLLDALAFRIKDKHLYTLKSMTVARLLYGSDYFGQMTRQLTFSNELFRTLAGQDITAPNIVTEYLRTHVYDENSL